MVGIRKKNAPLKSFAQSWSKSNGTIIVRYPGIFIALGYGYNGTVPNRLRHITMSKNSSEQRS